MPYCTGQHARQNAVGTEDGNVEKDTCNLLRISDAIVCFGLFGIGARVNTWGHDRVFSSRSRRSLNRDPSLPYGAVCEGDGVAWLELGSGLFACAGCGAFFAPRAAFFAPTALAAFCLAIAARQNA